MTLLFSFLYFPLSQLQVFLLLIQYKTYLLLSNLSPFADFILNWFRWKITMMICPYISYPFDFLTKIMFPHTKEIVLLFKFIFLFHIILSFKEKVPFLLNILLKGTFHCLSLRKFFSPFIAISFIYRFFNSFIFFLQIWLNQIKILFFEFFILLISDSFSNFMKINYLSRK